MLDLGQAFVGLDCLGGADGPGLEAGGDDVDAVEPGLGRDLGFIEDPGEVLVGDGDREVHLDPATVGGAPAPAVDPVAPTQARAGLADDAGRGAAPKGRSLGADVFYR